MTGIIVTDSLTSDHAMSEGGGSEMSLKIHEARHPTDQDQIADDDMKGLEEELRQRLAREINLALGKGAEDFEQDGATHPTVNTPFSGDSGLPMGVLNVVDRTNDQQSPSSISVASSHRKYTRQVSGRARFNELLYKGRPSSLRHVSSTSQQPPVYLSSKIIPAEQLSFQPYPGHALYGSAASAHRPSALFSRHAHHSAPLTHNRR